MDFFDDSLTSSDCLAVQLRPSSWPPAAVALPHWRSNSRAWSKLTSIPEASEQQDDRRRSLSFDAELRAPSINQKDAAISTAIASQSQRQDTQLADDGVSPQQDAAEVGGLSGGDHSRTSSSSEEAVEAELTTAAACTWVENIRHFTDCVPISPDSVCSSSTYCSLMVGVKDSSSSNEVTCQQQQQHSGDMVQLHQHQQQQCATCYAPAPAAVPCSLPNSSSSASLVPANDATAAGEAAVQASLLEALHELDELEFLPFDRVAQWLEAQAASGSAAGGHNLLASMSDDAAADSNARLQEQQQAALTISRGTSSEGSDRIASSNTKAAGAQQQEEALFDAPDWWQEAVLARLQQQRDAFQGSWWSRARVLASLAAQKAACALQV